MISVRRKPPLSYAVLSEDGQRGSVLAVHETSPVQPRQPRLLDRVRSALRTRHYSRRTEEAYVAQNQALSGTSSSTASATPGRWERRS